MRTTHSTIALCVLALAVAPAALTQCSGGSSSASPDAGKGNQNGSSGGGSGGGGGSNGGGGSSSGGSGDDGGNTSSSGGGGSSGAADGGGSSGGGEGGGGSSSGASIPVPDGGMPSDPGVLSCGATTCSTSSQHCCAEADAGGTCQPLNGSCPGNAVSQACKEAADCASGNVCCQLLAYGPNPTTCHAGSCPMGYFQPCRTDAECGSADAGAGSQKCIVQTCYTSMAMTTPVTVEACAYPTAGGGGTPGGGVPGGGVPGGFPGGGGGTVTWGPLPYCH